MFFPGLLRKLAMTMFVGLSDRFLVGYIAKEVKFWNEEYSPKQKWLVKILSSSIECKKQALIEKNVTAPG